MNFSNHARSLCAHALPLGLVAGLSLSACTDDPGMEDDEPTAEATDSVTASLGQEMAYINWFYCGQVGYHVDIQYWMNNAYTGVTVGAIHVDQSGPTTGIDYTVQIKTVHDNYHVWWTRSGTTTGPHLNFPASSTPSTVYPLSWEPYVRLYLGADRDGKPNCNFGADLD